MKRFLTLLFMLISFLIIAQKQNNCNSSLSGKILDEHNNEPLAYATIYIEELKKGTASDVEGSYRIENICDGKYKVIITHIGCEPVIQKVEVKGNTILNFYPEHHAHELGLMEVIEEKPKELSPQTILSIEKKDINKLPISDIGKAMENVPGVSNISSGSNFNKPVVNGLYGNRVLILNNGIRQEGQQWGLEHTPEIDPFSIEKIQIVQGANSVRYGSDALGGVILIEQKELPDSAEINGTIFSGFQSNGNRVTTNGMLEGQFKKTKGLSWRATGSYNKSGNQRTPDYYLDNTGSINYNYTFTTVFKRKKVELEAFYSSFNLESGILSFAHFDNINEFNEALELGRPLEKFDFDYHFDAPMQKVKHDAIKTSAKFKLGNKSELSFLYAYQNNNRKEFHGEHNEDEHFHENETLPELELNLSTHQFDISYTIDWSKKFNSAFGLNGIYQENKGKYEYLIPNYYSNNGGIFTIHQYKINKTLIEAGVRYDIKNLEAQAQTSDSTTEEFTRQFSNVAATLGWAQKIGNSFSVITNLGTAWRAPSAYELFSNGEHFGAISFEIGNPNLKQEIAYNSSLSLQFQKEKITVNLNSFYSYIENYVYIDNTSQLTFQDSSVLFTAYFLSGNVNLSGINGFVRYYITPSLSLTSRASFVSAYNETVKDFVPLIPPARFDNTLDYSFNNSKKMSGSYFQLNVIHIAQKSNLSRNELTTSPKDYTLINLYCGTSISVGKNKLKVAGGITNLLNKSYKNYMNRLRYFAHEQGINFSLRAGFEF